MDGQFYVLNTMGCSCPSPTETWAVYGGPFATKADVVEWLQPAPEGQWRKDGFRLLPESLEEMTRTLMGSK